MQLESNYMLSKLGLVHSYYWKQDMESNARVELRRNREEVEGLLDAHRKQAEEWDPSRAAEEARLTSLRQDLEVIFTRHTSMCYQAHV